MVYTEKCPNCLNNHTNRRGKYLYCKDCNKYYPLDDYGKPSLNSFQQKKDTAEVSAMTNRRIKSLKDLIAVCEIDESEWRIDRWVCNKWEVGAKDTEKRVQVSPLFQVKAWLSRRTPEIRARDAVKEIIHDASNYAPKYLKLKYPKIKEGMLYELDFPDIHLGKLTWSPESGQDYDIHITREVVNKALTVLLSYTQMFSVSKILLPIGNDFFNVDNKFDTTTGGTPQQEDTRWQKTFTFGRRMMVSMIEQCSAIAPVDVMVIVGNHDEQRSFYLGETLSAWFHRNPNVSVDNRPMKRRYYSFGVNLIGFTHGSFEKLDKLPSLMPVEAPELWAKSKYREWHLGDKHHLKNLRFDANEEGGVVIRHLRSLSATDTWHFDHGFVGSIQAAQAFLWHPSNGLIGQFTAASEN